MATVSIERYAQTLSSIDRNCADGVARLILDYASEYPDATIADLREFAISVSTEALDLYSGASIYAADALFDDMMFEEAVGIQTAPSLYNPDASKLADVAHYQVGKCDTVEEFARQMGDAVSYYSRDAAGKEVMAQVKRANGRRGGQGVRYARIPTGLETCTFCTMLASRGFDYKSADSAGHANHRGCNCLIVPGVKGKTSVRGYDTQALYDRWQRFNEIDEREGLAKAEQRMLKLATIDRETPLDLDGSRRLADSFDACMNTRKSAFLSNPTREVYDETVASLLQEIGGVYDMEIQGEYLYGPKLYSALPNGDEIWALTRMGERFPSVQFLGTDRTRRRGNPDLLVNGTFMDIKTPENPKRIGKHLNDAAVQCRNRGQQDGVSILSSLRLSADKSNCVDVATSRVSGGKLSTIYVVGPDGFLDEIKKSG